MTNRNQKPHYSATEAGGGGSGYLATKSPADRPHGSASRDCQGVCGEGGPADKLDAVNTTVLEILADDCRPSLDGYTIRLELSRRGLFASVPGLRERLDEMAEAGLVHRASRSRPNCIFWALGAGQ